VRPNGNDPTWQELFDDTEHLKATLEAGERNCAMAHVDESIHDDVVRQRDAFKAALEDHWDHDEVWCFACHQSFEECSARQALKELEEK